MKLSLIKKKIDKKIEIGDIVHCNVDGYTRVVKIENNQVYGWWVTCKAKCKDIGDNILGFGVDIKTVKLVK